MSTFSPPLMRSITRPRPVRRSRTPSRRYLPDLEPLGLFLREHDVAVAVLGLFEQHVDLVTDIDFRTAKLGQVDHALGLVADVDDDLFFEDLEDLAADDLAFLDRLEARFPRSQSGAEVLDLFDLDVGLGRAVAGGTGFGRVMTAGRRGLRFGVDVLSLLMSVHGDGVKPSLVL